LNWQILWIIGFFLPPVPYSLAYPRTHPLASACIASAARQVWCWDMTYLPTNVMGRRLHLYLILDMYSRKIVGWEVHDSDHSDHAVRPRHSGGTAYVVQSKCF